MVMFQSIARTVCGVFFILFASTQSQCTEHSTYIYPTSYQEIISPIKHKAEISTNSLPIDIPQLPHHTKQLSPTFRSQLMERFNVYVRNCDLAAMEEELVNYLPYIGNTFPEELPDSPPNISSVSWMTLLTHTPFYNQYIHARFHMQCLIAWNRLKKEALESETLQESGTTCSPHTSPAPLSDYVATLNEDIQALLEEIYPTQRQGTPSSPLPSSGEVASDPQRLILQADMPLSAHKDWHQKLETAHRFVIEALRTAYPGSSFLKAQTHKEQSFNPQSANSLHARFSEVFGVPLKQMPQYVYPLSSKDATKYKKWKGMFQDPPTADESEDDLIFQMDDEDYGSCSILL